MKTLQVRNVPDEVHRVLRMRAAEAGVSLSDYALTELQRLAERPTVAEVLLRARSHEGGAELQDVVDAVRAGRDFE